MLLRDGAYTPLTPKAFETLAVLVENSGRIVDKEELLRLVWPDTFIEEATLAKTVSILRKTLGEDAGRHYIDTVPKRGYRFAGSVSIADAPPADALSAPPLPDSPPPSEEAAHNLAGAHAAPPAKPQVTQTKLALAGLALILAAGGASFLAAYWASPRPDIFPAKATPLTSFPGRQSQVAFSPDGNQIAFTWENPQDGASHIFVKMVGAEALLQLTRGSGSDSKPAWSPDGRSVTFLRSTPEGRAWYITSALGGSERKLAGVMPFFDLGAGNSPYLSPDGKTLALVDKSAPDDPSAVFLLALDGSQKRKLTSPPQSTTGDYYPAFSPDGKRLAFARAASFSATDLYVMPLPAGKETRLTFDGLTIDGLAWSSNREIVFASRRGGSYDSLWRIPVTGGAPRRVSAFGEDVISPAVSRDGKRVAYARQLDDMNIWSYGLDEAGRVVTKAPLIVSTFRDSDPDFSPDGRRVAFTSGRNGSFGIWVSDSDGSNPRLLFDGGAYVTGTPRWSPDGRRIAFDTRAHDPVKFGNPSIWTVDADGGQARRLNEPGVEGVAPTWSRDGQWIYFASRRGGTLQIWKMPSHGGAAIQLTRNGGFEGFESPDGKYLLFVRGRQTPGIWRVPTSGGEEVLIADGEQIGYWRSWRVARGGLYFVSAIPPAAPHLDFLDLATGAIDQVTSLPKPSDPTIPGLAVSPDGRTLLIAQYDQVGSNIIMMERER